MNKNKIKYYTLIICTLGLIKLKWKKYRQQEVKDRLSTTEKIDFSINDLILFLGGEKNILNVETSNKKIKIGFKVRQDIDIEKIKKLDGISGVVATSSSISLVTGNNAAYIKKLIMERVENVK
ncbi:hypothetical protein ACWXVL_00390 [Mycoplasma sp. 128]|uniref:hypothetical protein n=1 Tax=Mycoplasma sp. 3341 TaxID=3447506 RepID=UPI003F657189